MATITITGSYNKSALIFSSNNAKIYEDHASDSDSDSEHEHEHEHVSVKSYVSFMLNGKKVLLRDPDPTM